MERARVRKASAPPAMAALLLVAGVGCGPASRSTIDRPTPVAPGVPGTTPPVTSVVGPDGGTLATPDGRVTVNIPRGAVEAPTSFSIQEITNTAPRGLGSAYRLEPSGTRFAVALAITFDTRWTTTPASNLGVSYQDATGYWVPVVSLLRNSAAQLVTVSSSHLSDWTLVPSNPTLDMAGAFTVASTVNTPGAFTATGKTALAYAGEDSVERVYLLSGTAALQPPTYAGATCTTDSPTHDLLANIAEVFKSPPSFSWGASALWNVACGATPSTVEMVFDTAGISHIGCARGYTLGAPPPVATQDALQGDYTIDCTSQGNGTLRVVWAVQRCGAPCTSSNPCATSAAVSCTTGTPVCTDLTTAPVGTSCTVGGAPGVCNDTGVCTPCSQGSACTSTNPCAATATIVCSSGAPACTDQTFAPAGTPCTSGTVTGVCSPAGACGACAAGAACTSSNPCATSATIDCSAGAPVCTDRTFAAAGTSCGTNAVCSAAGTCGACAAGAACTSSNPCTTSATIDCTTGAPVCTDRTFAAAGTSCGTDAVCSAAGSCGACAAGAPCTSTNLCATAAAISCDTGVPVCTDTTFLPDGASCGASDICVGGACSVCSPGTPCVPSANPCDVGTVQCADPATGAPASCVDTGVPVTCPAGQSCDPATGRCG